MDLTEIGCGGMDCIHVVENICTSGWQFPRLSCCDDIGSTEDTMI